MAARAEEDDEEEEVGVDDDVETSLPIDNRGRTEEQRPLRACAGARALMPMLLQKRTVSAFCGAQERIVCALRRALVFPRRKRKSGFEKRKMFGLDAFASSSALDSTKKPK